MRQLTESDVIALAAAMAGTGGGGGTGDGDMKKTVYDDTNAVADAGGIINYLISQGYVTTTALNTALDDYTTTTDLTTLLDAKVNVSDHLTSSEVAALKALL